MFGSAAVLGVVSVVIAAWLPAAAAAKMDPVRALRAGSIIEQSANLSPAWLWAGLTFDRCRGSVFVLGPRDWASLAGFRRRVFRLERILFPRACKSPLRFSACRESAAAWRDGRGLVEANLAAANVARSLVRNSVTIAALAAAVAMAIGVSVMVFSFRRTVESWIDQTLVADLFIAPASNEIVGAASFIPPAAIEFLEAHPAVAAVDTFRDVGLPMGDETIAVAVVRGTDRRQLRFLRGDGASDHAAFLQ